LLWFSNSFLLLSTAIVSWVSQRVSPVWFFLTVFLNSFLQPSYPGYHRGYRYQQSGVSLQFLLLFAVIVSWVSRRASPAWWGSSGTSSPPSCLPGPLSTSSYGRDSTRPARSGIKLKTAQDRYSLYGWKGLHSCSKVRIKLIMAQDHKSV
jgi:hypothetical protein